MVPRSCGLSGDYDPANSQDARCDGRRHGRHTHYAVPAPPAFLYYYGVSKYGEWLVLSATVSYLSTLNFGITTYASNELTMLRKRGEMDKYCELQGSTLALLLCMICVGIAVSASVFFLPLPRLLHLSTISPMEVILTAFFGPSGDD
jgi:O-antigen/teichoic acid export membrane protein